MQGVGVEALEFLSHLSVSLNSIGIVYYCFGGESSSGTAELWFVSRRFNMSCS